MTEFSLMTIFLAIGGLGFLFLLISFIVGDIFEALGLEFGLDLDGNGDFGLLDSRVIAMFLTAFGGFAAIGAAIGYGALVGSLFGFGGGVFFGAVVFYFGRFLYRQQSSSSIPEEALIGRTAQVVVPIHARQIGQITCRIGEERIEKIARARGDAEIKAGALVRIEEITGDAVIVSVEDGSGFSLFSEKA